MKPLRLLLATDGSEPSLEAARLVRDLLNPTALEHVTVLAVAPSFGVRPYYVGYGMYGMYDEGAFSEQTQEAIDAAAERTVQDALQRTVAELAAVGAVETVVRHGSPADEIVRYAKESGAGMIVMGSRGWGEMHAVLRGSVSEWVLHKAPCPVLITRAPDAQSANAPQFAAAQHKK